MLVVRNAKKESGVDAGSSSSSNNNLSIIERNPKDAVAIKGTINSSHKSVTDFISSLRERYSTLNPDDFSKNEFGMQLFNQVEQVGEFYRGNTDSINKYINPKAVCLSAMMIKVIKPKAKPTGVSDGQDTFGSSSTTSSFANNNANNANTGVKKESTPFVCLIGNIRSGKIPDLTRLHEDYLNITMKAKGENKMPLPPGIEEMQFFPIKQFGFFMFSVMGTIDPSIKFGDLVELKDIKASRIYSESGSSACYLNVGAVELIKKNACFGIYRQMVRMDTIPVTPLKPEEKKLDVDSSKAQYGDDYIILHVTPYPDLSYEERPGVTGGILTQPDYRVNAENDWKFKKMGSSLEDVPKIHMKTSITCHQWCKYISAFGADKGELRQFTETCLVDLVVYEQELYPFCIRDVNAWFELAPLIFKNMPYVVIGKADIKRTAGMSVNAAKVGQYKYGISLVVSGFITCIPSTYRAMGFKVSKGFVLDYLKNPNSRSKYAYDQSIDDDTELICLNEYKGDINMLVSSASYNLEFRAITNAILTNENLNEIPHFTEKESDLILKTKLEESSRRRAPSGKSEAERPKLTLMCPTPALRVYIFAIFVDKLTSGVSENSNTNSDDNSNNNNNSNAPTDPTPESDIERRDKKIQSFLYGNGITNYFPRLALEGNKSEDEHEGETHDEKEMEAAMNAAAQAQAEAEEEEERKEREERENKKKKKKESIEKATIEEIDNLTEKTDDSINTEDLPDEDAMDEEINASQSLLIEEQEAAEIAAIVGSKSSSKSKRDSPHKGSSQGTKKSKTSKHH